MLWKKYGRERGNNVENQVNILGTNYIIIEDNDYLIASNADGECRPYAKQILIRNENNMLEKDLPVLQKMQRKNEVLRHEIIHAFFYESGLDDYCIDEKLVTYLSIQFPKLQSIFEKLDIEN